MKPLPHQDLEDIQRFTQTLWEGVRGKRIFLTGATGSFGVWLLESFVYYNRALNLGASASVLCRNPDAVVARLPLANENSIQWIQGDIRTYAFPSGEFEFVIHAATPTTAAVHLDPLDLLSTIIDGTRRTVAFAREHRTKRFLCVSSGAVYGPQPESLVGIPEDHRGGPDWTRAHAAYAEGKRVAEMMCIVLARESSVDVRIARCFAFVGPHFPLDPHFAIGNFIANALAGRDIQSEATGHHYEFICMHWIWRSGSGRSCSQRYPQRKSRAVYNVGSGAPISIKELAEHVAAELNPDLRIGIAQSARPGALSCSMSPMRERPPLSSAFLNTLAYERPSAAPRTGIADPNAPLIKGSSPIFRTGTIV